VSYRIAWLIKHKLLHSMALAESKRQHSGRVELDDAYIDGETSGGNTGRGSKKKVPFVVAVQTTEGAFAHLALSAATLWSPLGLGPGLATLPRASWPPSVRPPRLGAPSNAALATRPAACMAVYPEAH
jgi:hypothetical protein